MAEAGPALYLYPQQGQSGPDDTMQDWTERTMLMAVTTNQRILSDDILARCAERAPIYDQENRFFTEDFEELRQAGYLRMAVPQCCRRALNCATASCNARAVRTARCGACSTASGAPKKATMPSPVNSLTVPS
jgi:hypothetical protein